MRSNLAFLVTALVAFSCTDSGTGPEERRFNFLFRYGVGTRNELDTFNNSYTKDLVVDGTRTIRLVLSQADFDFIESTLLDAEIFTYPDTFVVQSGDSVMHVAIYPGSLSYILQLSLNGRKKALVWHDHLFTVAPDSQATKLRETFQSLQALIEAKAEYQRLPPARGGYL